MNKKQVWNDFKDILYYFVTEPPQQVYNELKDIWRTVTNKRVWIWAWGIMFMVFAFIGNKQLKVFSLVMFLSFFIIQHIQERKWKGRAREKWFKQHGIKRYRKPKKQPRQ